nr:hypothetical protein [Snodgrassella sp. CFCC 13594]
MGELGGVAEEWCMGRLRDDMQLALRNALMQVFPHAYWGEGIALSVNQ